MVYEEQHQHCCRRMAALTYNPSGVKVCLGLFSGVATSDDSRPGSGWKKRRKKTVKMEGNVGERERLASVKMEECI